MKANKDGSLIDLKAHELTSGNYSYIQAFTTIEVIYYGGNFVIVGNPIVLSKTDYTIYADGLNTKEYIEYDLTDYLLPIIKADASASLIAIKHGRYVTLRWHHLKSTTGVSQNNSIIIVSSTNPIPVFLRPEISLDIPSYAGTGGKMFFAMLDLRLDGRIDLINTSTFSENTLFYAVGEFTYLTASNATE